MKEHSKNSGPTGLEPEICHAVHHQLSHQANWLLWPTTIITSILCFIPTFIIFDFHTHCTYTLLPPLNQRLEQVNMLCEAKIFIIDKQTQFYALIRSGLF